MIKPRVTVTSKDKGWDALVAEMKKLSRAAPDLRVGVLGDGDARDDGPLTNVQIAAIHEYGAPAAGIPERSFIRSTFERKRASYVQFLKKVLPLVYAQQMKAGQVLGILGERMVADIKLYITQGAGVPPPLKPATVARKGSARPLVDTGQLLNAITWALVRGGK